MKTTPYVIFSYMDRPGTCLILDKKYNIANSSCHFGSYGSIWTGPTPKKYYMDLRSFDPYTIFLVTDRSIYCHMTLSAMNYLLYSVYFLNILHHMYAQSKYIGKPNHCNIKVFFEQETQTIYVGDLK